MCNEEATEIFTFSEIKGRLRWSQLAGTDTPIGAGDP